MWWLLDWLWWLAWYGLVAGGYLCWWKAHCRANRLNRELTRLAYSLRYTAKY